MWGRTTAVELQGALESDHGGDVVLRLGIGVLLESGVEVGHVRLVVFSVVDLHNLAADGRLELAIVIGEIGEHGRGAQRAGPERKGIGGLSGAGSGVTEHDDDALCKNSQVLLGSRSRAWGTST